MLKGRNAAMLGAALSDAMAAARRRPIEVPEAGYVPLVTIQKGRRGAAPLFCIPGAGGNVGGFADLAHALGAEWPIEGLQPRGLDGVLLPHATVSAAACLYLQAIRQRRPEGPLHLLGHSFGGWTAFETASRLRAAGRAVSSLTLLDSRPPDGEGAPWREYSAVEALMRLVGLFEQAAERSLGIAPADVESLDEAAGLALLHERLAGAGVVSPRSRAATLAGPLRVFEASLRTRYRPAALYPGPVRFVLAADPAGGRRADGPGAEEKIEGWRRWAPGLVVLRSSGNHMTMLRRPHVGALADDLRETLQSLEEIGA